MATRNFLVAVDMTDEAEDVLQAARELANRLDADLTAVTVVRPMSMVYGEIGLGPFVTGAINIQDEAVKSAKTELTAMGERHDIDAARCKVLLGAPAVEIRNLAEEANADLIVIGTHGRHGLGLMLGSTANAVLHGVPCDVYAVRIRPKSE